MLGARCKKALHLQGLFTLKLALKLKLGRSRHSDSEVRRHREPCRARFSLR